MISVVIIYVMSGFNLAAWLKLLKPERVNGQFLTLVICKKIWVNFKWPNALFTM